jgi:hypothetical protein
LVIEVSAQSAISLSITPPLTEIIIQPGKEVRQTYILQNGGGDTTLLPKMVYFTTSDDFGNVNLTEEAAPDWVKYSKDPINLKFEGQKTFSVSFNPPEDTPETDHYFTLVFESQTPVDLLSITSTFYKSVIGSNILVTISKDGNPKKSAEIVKFEAPKIIDSMFGKINYKVIIKNNGNYYWKPVGKINIQNSDSIKIAPLNILSGNNREISCLKNEELKSCEFDDFFLFGKITSTLEFSLDEDPKIYKQSATTIALPFGLIILLLILLTLVRIRGIFIFRVWGRKK